MTDDDYDALSQKQLASIKRDMRISLEDAAVRATYKVMAELAQPEQEPVAFYVYKPTLPRGNLGNVSDSNLPWVYDQDPSSGYSARMLVYTTPPQRTWVGLTDEEIKQGESKEELGHGFIQGALWAEATLKEKNT